MGNAIKASFTRWNLLFLYGYFRGEKIGTIFILTLYSTNYVKPINARYGQNVKTRGTRIYRRSRWPRGLRRRCRSAAARLLWLWVRIPPVAWTFVCCECCVLSGRGLCDELITRPEESYRLWGVVVCDLETSRMRRPWPIGGCRANNKQTNKQTHRYHCALEV